MLDPLGVWIIKKNFFYILFFVYLPTLFSIFCADLLLIMIPSPPMWQSLVFGGLGSYPVWLGNIGVYNWKAGWRLEKRPAFANMRRLNWLGGGSFGQ